MKRQPTEEQKAKAAQRREQFKAIAKQVAAMSDEDKARMTTRIGAVMTCEGRALSLHNTLMLLLQIPNVSMVGGFRQWLKAGRCVRKGEHGAMIWVRTGTKGAASDIATVDCPKPESNGESDSRFLMGTVFDVSQTQEANGVTQGEAQ